MPFSAAFVVKNGSHMCARTSGAMPVPAHRKACAIVRAGLEPDDVYVDVAVHGDGLIEHVPSWSPDSSQVAFVSYRHVLP